MKKSLLIIAIAAIALTGCKKKEAANDFTATDLTGNATLKGALSKRMITPNQGFGYGNVNVPAVGVLITVRVSNNQLYPNSPTAQGSEVYSTTSDANGNYNLSVKANGSGVSATITVSDVYGTIDTLINTFVKTGVNANFPGTVVQRQLYKGVSTDYNYNFVGNPTTAGGNNIYIGTAIITGTCLIPKMQQSSVTATLFTSQMFPLPNHLVSLSFDRDPVTQVVKTYTTMSDANGVYTFNVSSTIAGIGFNNISTLKIWDYHTTYDTVMASSTIKQGRPGVFQNAQVNVNNCTPNTYQNSKNIAYPCCAAFILD